MRKIRKKLLVYGLLAVFLLSITSVAAADTATGTAAPAERTASLFNDVAAGDSNSIYINYLAQREIISGFPDGGFHPAEGLSRAQAAVLLVKAAGLETAEAETGGFTDIGPSHWAAGSIAAAAKAGYLKGFPDGTFQPDQTLTRAQGISLVLRLSQQEDPGVELPRLKDLDDNHWASRSAAIGLAAGMVGLSDDKSQFFPDQEFSRGDLSRALALLLTTDPDLMQISLQGSLEVKAGTVKVNDRTIEKSTAIKAGDTIILPAGAEAWLSYPDGTGILLKEKTTLEVKEARGASYIKNGGVPGTGTDWLLVNLKQGEIFGALATNPNIKEETAGEQKTAGRGLLADRSGDFDLLAASDQETPWYQAANQKKVKVKVDMPWGVAAIRGTFWSNLVTGSGCGTTLLQGDAEVSGGGQSQSLTPGSGSIMNQGAPPTPPAPMTPQQASQWGQQSGWLQNTAQQIQSNQPATQPPAGITAPPQPGQPPAPAPQAPAGNLLNTINQSLIQAQQQAGIVNPQGLNTPSPGGGSLSPGGDSGQDSGTVGITSIEAPEYRVFTPDTYPDDEVTIHTSGIPAGTAITVELLTADGKTPVADASASAAVSSGNITSIPFTIPSGTPIGKYIIKATAGAYSKEAELIIDYWKTLGDNWSAALDSGIGLALNSDGFPYVAYVDSNGVQVKVSYEEGFWTNLTSPSPLPTSGNIVDLNFRDDALRAAYLNDDGVPVVSSYGGDSEWTFLPPLLEIPPVGGVTSLSLSNRYGNPYLAYLSGSSVSAYVYNDGWQQQYMTITDAAPAGAISLDVTDSHNYLAYRTNDSDSKVKVFQGNYSLNGDGWPSNASPALAAHDGNDSAYIAYRDESAGGKGRVMQYMYYGGTPSNLGYFSGEAAVDHISLALDGSDIPYVAYSDGSQDGKLTVMYLDPNSPDGAEWKPLGITTGGFTAEAVEETRIKIFGDSVYVMYKSSDSTIGVMRYNKPIP
jgi:hypothetical protein